MTSEWSFLTLWVMKWVGVLSVLLGASLMWGCKKPVLDVMDDTEPYVGIYQAKSDMNAEPFELFVFKISNSKVKMESTFGDWPSPIEVLADVSPDSLKVHPQYIDSIYFVVASGFSYENGIQFNFKKVNGKTQTVVLNAEILAEKKE